MNASSLQSKHSHPHMLAMDQSQQITAALKQFVKEKGVAYAMLAQKFRLREASVGVFGGVGVEAEVIFVTTSPIVARGQSLIPAKAGIHWAYQSQQGFPPSRERHRWVLARVAKIIRSKTSRFPNRRMTALILTRICRLRSQLARGLPRPVRVIHDRAGDGDHIGLAR